MRNRSPLSQFVWCNLDGRRAIDVVPTIADINTIAGGCQKRKNGDSLSEEKTSRVSTVLTGIEFVQANVYLSSNNLVTPEHLSHFLDWINQVNRRWILKTLLLPRLPTTEIFATKLLPCAVRANDLEAIRFLLSVGASPNARTYSVFMRANMRRIEPFKSALCEAIGNNNITIVRLLFVSGAEINPVINITSGPLPLQEAILLASPAQMVKTLLMYGANVDPAIPRMIEQLAPPLILAVSSGKAWTVQTLLKAGANVNIWIPKHGTALQAAVASDNIPILRILVHEGADVNAQTFLSMKSRPWCLSHSDLYGPSLMSPIASATQNGNMAIVRILLEAGADINAHVSHENLQYHLNDNYANYLSKSESRKLFRRITRTPLQTSLYQGNVELVQFLLEAGASVNLVHNEDGLLQIAIRRSNMELVELLLSYGAPICTPALWPIDMTPVQAAAENGNPAFLRALLDNTTDIAGYPSINEGPSPHGGRTALQFAAEKGHVEMVEFLLALGADVHGPVAERNGITTLQATARSRNTDVAHLVIAAGAGTNVPYGTTFALAIAIKNNDLAMFNLLFQYDMDVNSWPTDISSSLLESAAWSRSTFYLRKLLSLGINVNVRWLRNHKQTTALETAVSSRHLDAVRLLLQAGADIKAYNGHDIGGDALSVAVLCSQVDIAKLLLEAGVDVKPKIGLRCNDIGSAAIARAALNLDTDMVILLLQHGADPSAEAPRNTNLLANAVIGSDEEKPREVMVRLLLDAGAQINNRVEMTYDLDADGLPGSLLAVAAESGTVKLVRLLLGSGADPNWRDGLEYWTALQCAIASSSDDVVHVILEAGADINASPSTTGGRTALQEAASQGNLELVQLLLQKGADVNSPAGEERGVTALQAASIKGHLAVVVQLLYAGADVNGESSESEGRTALQGAAESGRLDIVILLLENDRKMEAPTIDVKMLRHMLVQSVIGLLRKYYSIIANPEKVILCCK